MSKVGGNGGNLLLGILPSEARERLAIREEDHPIRDVLMTAEDVPRFIYFPHPGAVTSIVRPTVSGQLVEAGVVGAEGLVSVHTLLAPSMPTGSHAIVQSEGRFSRAESPRVREVFDTDDRFREALLSYTSVFLDQVSQNLVCNRLHPIEQRLAKWLLMMRDRVSNDDLHLTQDFLASMLGVYRPGVSLAVSALESEGLIRHRRNWIELRDREGTMARACECYRPLGEKLIAFAESLV
jgi:CRP-like cAMP-binding protein